MGIVTGALVFAFLFAHHHVVVAAGLVDADKHHTAMAKAGVFHKLLAQLALLLQCQGGLAQAAGAGEHHFAQVRQALQGIEAAVVAAVAIGPLVVAWHINHRLGHAVEHLERVGINLIGAFAAAVLDVAVIQRESNVRLVDAFQHSRQFGVVPRFFVGHVAPQTKAEGLDRLRSTGAR